MSLNRLLFTAVLLLLPTAVAAEARCPASNGGAGLRTVTLFDGPPSEHADLAPDSVAKVAGGTRSAWQVAYVFEAGRQLFVECDYGRRGGKVVLKPERGVRRCLFEAKASGNALVCK
jgi:hypothetical protein